MTFASVKSKEIPARCFEKVSETARQTADGVRSMERFAPPAGVKTSMGRCQ